MRKMDEEIADETKSAAHRDLASTILSMMSIASSQSLSTLARRSRKTLFQSYCTRAMDERHHTKVVCFLVDELMNVVLRYLTIIFVKIATISSPLFRLQMLLQ